MDYHKLTLKGGLIGIEREALRVNKSGFLATTCHPTSLGSASTHPNITIDYAETMLELVTNAHHSAAETYQELSVLHRFCAQNIGDELMWPVSMPCILPQEEDIEIGYFGTSNAGKFRRLYRNGLALRYGKFMQMISGIHYNYSPPELLFDELAALENIENNQDFRNIRYMGMLRTLQRVSWLICYLYGASPAVDKTFLPAINRLNPLNLRSLSWENATTLRMSNLGYQNKVDFAISFDNLESYSRDLMSAVSTPAPSYEYIGWRNPDGSFKQISPNILQIENEYYTAARPKQIQKMGEMPSIALKNRGIRYVEFRILDVNPYDPCGISLEQMRVLEALLLWALLNPTPPFGSRDINEQNTNRSRAACCGLNPEMMLSDRGHKRPVQEWAEALLRQIFPVAEALSIEHQRAIERLLTIKTPLVSRIRNELKTQEFIDWGLNLIEEHRGFLTTPLLAEELTIQKQNAEKSRISFAEIENAARKQIPFDVYLNEYFRQLEEI